MIPSSRESGFSAIELLITLFIGVAFIGSGYQLYSIAVADGRDIRLRAQASSIAYSQMRTTAASATNPCTTSTSYPSVPTGSNAQISPTMTATIACPYGTSSSTSSVTVTLSYGTDNPKKQVAHAIFTTAQ